MATLEEHETLIKEIKGIRRVVINTCHGGFGLSNEAILRYLNLCGVHVWPEINHSYLKTVRYWLVPPEKRVNDISPEDWGKMTIAQRSAHNQKYDQQVFCDRELPRDDSFLIQTVFELGDRASGDHAELKIVEIPEDVDWIIEEYDGKEWVAEKHRTWS